MRQKKRRKKTSAREQGRKISRNSTEVVAKDNYEAEEETTF